MPTLITNILLGVIIYFLWNIMRGVYKMNENICKGLRADNAALRKIHEELQKFNKEQE